MHKKNSMLFKLIRIHSRGDIAEKSLQILEI